MKFIIQLVKRKRGHPAIPSYWRRPHVSSGACPAGHGRLQAQSFHRPLHPRLIAQRTPVRHARVQLVQLRLLPASLHQLLPILRQRQRQRGGVEDAAVLRRRTKVQRQARPGPESNKRGMTPCRGGGAPPGPASTAGARRPGVNSSPTARRGAAGRRASDATRRERRRRGKGREMPLHRWCRWQSPVKLSH